MIYSDLDSRQVLHMQLHYNSQVQQAGLEDHHHDLHDHLTQIITKCYM